MSGTATTTCPVCQHTLAVDERSQVRHADPEVADCTCPCDGSYADPHRHPTGDRYAPTSDGHVRVESLATGRIGTFRPDGTWVGGALKCADPHMVSFVTSLPVERDE